MRKRRSVWKPSKLISKICGQNPSNWPRRMPRVSRSQWINPYLLTGIAEHEEMSQQLVEAQALQKQIRDMELELARIKATHPPENVCDLSLQSFLLNADNPSENDNQPSKWYFGLPNRRNPTINGRARGHSSANRSNEGSSRQNR